MSVKNKKPGICAFGLSIGPGVPVLFTLQLYDSDYCPHDDFAMDSNGRILFCREKRNIEKLYEHSMLANIVPKKIPKKLFCTYSLSKSFDILIGEVERDTQHELLEMVLFLLDCLECLDRTGVQKLLGKYYRILVKFQLHDTINTSLEEFFSANKHISRNDIRKAFLWAIGIVVSNARIID